jgi:hypothetical protein
MTRNNELQRIRDKLVGGDDKSTFATAPNAPVPPADAPAKPILTCKTCGKVFKLKGPLEKHGQKCEKSAETLAVQSEASSSRSASMVVAP